ncbi:hypothetical protein [Lapidilactobacillus wuchangensis]|uniref:hypothetical protein n=1 Tax=Lapidilactobacillus wuchangensis TaxID=2486001 RepID=UPI001CDC54FD|nr:hypothetical protein [Lapidilactobacillus wuchangensis]
MLIFKEKATETKLLKVIEANETSLVNLNNVTIADYFELQRLALAHNFSVGMIDNQDPDQVVIINNQDGVLYNDGGEILAATGAYRKYGNGLEEPVYFEEKLAQDINAIFDRQPDVYVTNYDSMSGLIADIVKLRQFKGQKTPLYVAKDYQWVVDTEHGVEAGDLLWVASEFAEIGLGYRFETLIAGKIERDHERSFEDVLRSLLHDFKHFSIKGYETDYSQQELAFLKAIQTKAVAVSKEIDEQE